MPPLDRIPVTITTKPWPTALELGTALLRLPANTNHGHRDGEHCIACAAQLDIRARLFNLLEESRQGLRPPFTQVLVDASAVPNQAPLVAALQGELPAQGLRDHTVARRFYLTED